MAVQLKREYFRFDYCCDNGTKISEEVWEALAIGQTGRYFYPTHDLQRANTLATSYVIGMGIPENRHRLT